MAKCYEKFGDNIKTRDYYEAAINHNVKKVIVLSTDKAAYPINAMGMSKAMMKKVAIATIIADTTHVSLFILVQTFYNYKSTPRYATEYSFIIVSLCSKISLTHFKLIDCQKSYGLILMHRLITPITFKEFEALSLLITKTPLVVFELQAVLVKYI